MNPALPVLVPLAGAALAALATRLRLAPVRRFALLVLALASVLALIGLARGAEATSRLPWVPALGLEWSLRGDRLGDVAALLILVLGALALWQGSSPHGRQTSSGIARLLFIVAFAELAVLADNLLLVAAACACTALAAFCNDEVTPAGAWSGATLRFVVSGAGTLALLAAALLLADATGSASIGDALASAPSLAEPPLGGLLGWLLAVGAWTQSATWPCGEWLRTRGPTDGESATGALVFVLGACLAIRLLPLISVGVARPGVIAGFVVAPFVCAWLARALQLAPASEA